MIIAQGAEAKISLEDGKIIKDRFEKAYRHKEIDLMLRTQRTKTEVRILKKLEDIIPVPSVLNCTSTTITMQYIESKILKDELKPEHASQIGKIVAQMHEKNVVHADLTTSNMLLADKIHLIDFGLAYSTQRIEDFAVDIHVFKEALESKHHKIAQKCMKLFIEAYSKHFSKAKQVLERLETVENRGRNKSK